MSLSKLQQRCIERARGGWALRRGDEVAFIDFERNRNVSRISRQESMSFDYGTGAGYFHSIKGEMMDENPANSVF